MLSRRQMIAAGAGLLVSGRAFAQDQAPIDLSGSGIGEGLADSGLGGGTTEAALAAADPLAPRLVQLTAPLPPGELHVDPNRFGLYLTLPDGMALRYSCGIGREGLYEAGSFYIGAKKEWPSWTPTPEMIAREPDHYAQYADGMPGGPDNPLGARALYLFTPEKGDSFLRIHGTNAPTTIGTAVSNGCARLVNDDIIDLYDRVVLDAPVFLYPKSA